MSVAIKNCYVVAGTTGEGADIERWIVRVYRFHANASTFVALANQWLRDHNMHEGQGRRQNMGSVPTEFDPHLRVDYTGARYFLEGPVPLDWPWKLPAKEEQQP